MSLIYDRQQEIITWAAKNLQIDNPYPCSAIGFERGGFLIGACIYNNFHFDAFGKPLSIEISLACVDFHAITRQTIRAVLAYPFLQLQVKRLQATCGKRNKSVRRYVERLGFKLEGVSREGWRLGGDAVIYSMLHDECKWIEHNEPRRR